MNLSLRFIILAGLLSVGQAYAFAVFDHSQPSAESETQFIVLKRVSTAQDKEMVKAVAKRDSAGKTAALNLLKSKVINEVRETLVPPEYTISRADACALIVIASMPFCTIALALYLTWSSIRAREDEWRSCRRGIYRGRLTLNKADKAARIRNRFNDMHARRGRAEGAFDMEKLAENSTPLPENLTVSQLMFLTKEDVLAAGPQKESIQLEYPIVLFKPAENPFAPKLPAKTEFESGISNTPKILTIEVQPAESAFPQVLEEVA